MQMDVLFYVLMAINQCGVPELIRDQLEEQLFTITKLMRVGMELKT